MTFVSLSSEERNKKDEDETVRDETVSKKRLANKIDKLFMMLYEDLNLLIEWEQEEKKKVEE